MEEGASPKNGSAGSNESAADCCEPIALRPTARECRPVCFLNRAALGGLVIGAHVFALKLFGGVGAWPVIAANEAQPGPTLVMTQLSTERTGRYVQPVSEVSLANVPIEVNVLTWVDFDSVDDDLTAIVGPASAPRPSAHQPMDTGPFARCAGLQQGQSANVLLTIEVRTDGKLGAVDVARSGGSAAVDTEAIRFVRSLQWIPGTRNHEAQVMRITFPVALVGEGSSQNPRSAARCVGIRDACIRTITSRRLI